MNEQFLIEVYKAEREQFNRTRELQWKINISFWTLLVLGINNTDKMSVISNDAMLILILIVFGTYCWFVKKIQDSLDTNKKMWSKAFDIVHTIELMNLKYSELLNSVKKDKNNSTMWPILQMAITITLLSILCANIIGCNCCSLTLHNNLIYWFLISFLILGCCVTKLWIDS